MSTRVGFLELPDEDKKKHIGTVVVCKDFFLRIKKTEKSPRTIKQVLRKRVKSFS